MSYIKTYPDDPIINGFLYYGLDSMLFGFSEKNPPVEEQLYLFMKRFNTQPSEFYSLDRKMRLILYKRELSLVEEEYKQAKSAGSSSS